MAPNGFDQSAAINQPFGLPLRQRRPAAMGYPLTFAGLWLFTLVLYLRPNDLLPIGSFPLVKIVGIATLAAFLLEGLSSGDLFAPKAKEVKYLLWLTVLVFLSVPLAIDPGEAFTQIQAVFLKVVLVFILMVSVTTSYGRLLGLMRLAVLCGAAIAAGTLKAFMAGEDLVLHYRAAGVVGGMFGNPNDLAFALCLLIPLALGLCFNSTAVPSSLLYLGSAGVMAAAVLVTYSRAGFLALAVTAGYLFFAMRRQMSRIAILLLPIVIATVLVKPSLYGERILSIVNSSLDLRVAAGSAAARTAVLLKGFRLFAFNPRVWLVGVGFANFHIVSIHEQVTHNAYLEVLTEIGLPAFILYLRFLTGAFRGLGRFIGPESGEATVLGLRTMALVLRASLLAYMVGSFFGSVAYQWYLYYIAGFAICLRQIGEAAAASAAGEKRA